MEALADLQIRVTEKSIESGPKLNARRAIYTITRSRFSRNLCIPNYTPDKWWECDVFEATKSGRFREYEIKLSRSDFFTDAQKQRYFNIARGGSFGMRIYEKKFELLASRSDRGPTRFWYVVPAGLVQPSEVPEWAGLIELWPRKSLYPGSGIWPWGERQTVKAPLLHAGKCNPKTIQRAEKTCYWRMHRLMERLANPRRDRRNG